MRRLGIALAILLALLVAADRVAVLAADRVVADRIEAQQGLSARPSVSIGGFPFLTQAISGRYDNVTLTVHDLHKTAVAVHTLTVRLQGVHVALHAVFSGSVPNVPIDRADARVQISYADLNAYLAQRHLHVADAGSGDLRVTGSAAGASVTGRGRLHLDGSTVDVVVGNGLDFTIPLAGLPFRITLTGTSVTRSGVEVTGTAAGLVLHPH